ncbi:MAG: hypothetical protein NVV74_25580 [Magnetospirillum sp.]|nr:hypothetical protein [Magnetospirillum sp.]
MPFLVKDENLADVADKAAARANVGVYSKAEVDASEQMLKEVIKLHGKCRLLRTSSTTLRLLPWNGGSLVVNGKACLIPDEGVSVGNAALAANCTYYVYAADLDADGVVDAVVLSPTGTAAVSPFGIRVKADDAGIQFVDDEARRWVRSWFNDPGLSAYSNVPVYTLNDHLLSLGRA